MDRTLDPFLLRQGEPGTSQYIYLIAINGISRIVIIGIFVIGCNFSLQKHISIITWWRFLFSCALLQHLRRNQAEIENAENVTVDEQGDDDEHIVLAEYLSDDEAKEDEKSDEEDESDDHVTKVWLT